MTTIALPKRSENKYETDWSRWARNLAPDGVIYGELNNLVVEGYSGGMLVRVKSGTASVRGFYFHNPSDLLIPIDAADATNDRIDCVVMQMDISAEAIDADDDPVQLTVVKGTPASSPVAPSLMNDDTVYDVVLAEVFIQAQASTIAAEDVSDERKFSNAEDFSINLFVPLTEVGKCPAVVKVPEDCEILRWHLINPFGQSGSCSINLLSSMDMISTNSHGNVNVSSANSSNGTLTLSSLTKGMFLFADVISFSGTDSINLILDCRKVR